MHRYIIYISALLILVSGIVNLVEARKIVELTRSPDRSYESINRIRVADGDIFHNFTGGEPFAPVCAGCHDQGDPRV